MGLRAGVSLYPAPRPTPDLAKDQPAPFQPYPMCMEKAENPCPAGIEGRTTHRFGVPGAAIDPAGLSFSDISALRCGANFQLRKPILLAVRLRPLRLGRAARDQLAHDAVGRTCRAAPPGSWRNDRARALRRHPPICVSVLRQERPCPAVWSEIELYFIGAGFVRPVGAAREDRSGRRPGAVRISEQEPFFDFLSG